MDEKALFTRLVSLIVYPPWSDGARGMAPGAAVRIDVRGW
jgi:hypothetical protein